MSRPQEVNKLLNKLNNNVGKGPAQSSQRFEHYLLPELDVNAYKTGQAWPGKSYVLLGNSFCVQKKAPSKKALTKRKSALATLFQQAKNDGHCVTVEDALSNDSFNEILSRFEHDWLRRMPGNTLLGPAYDDKGHLIAESFAVWKAVTTTAQKRTNKALAKV